MNIQIKLKKLTLEQQHAVELGCDLANSIVGITGGAGTGKTLVLGEMYKELGQRQISTILCAPTGRAARRVEELTKIHAVTIHRLLGFPVPGDPDDPNDPCEPGQPRFCKGNPLPYQCVIVDEASMIGPTLYRQLMNALPKGGVIRMFGDNNQLPPVEEGTPPFFMILDKFPAVELSYNFRSDDLIVSNAARILAKRIPIRNERFNILYSDNPLKMMLDMVTQDFAGIDHQIIMPTRKGKFGTMRVNPTLQLRFNPKGEVLRLDRYDEKENMLSIRANDKFLWIKNDYKLRLFNGEIGTVNWVDEEDGTLELRTLDNKGIFIPPRMKTFSPYHGTVIDYDPRKQIELGYAITTHKAQGSEFETIIYCICAGQAYLLNRRNLYTAVTRAKHHVIIVTDRRAMGLSMRSV